MGDIIQFPTRAARAWPAVEATLRASLQKAGAPLTVTERVCARLKAAHAQWATEIPFTLSLQLPATVQPQTADALAESVRVSVMALMSRVHAVTNEMLLEILQLELALALRDHGDPPELTA